MSFLNGLAESEQKARIWYRHATTGDRAFLVEINGVQMIQLDRPNEEIVKKFEPTDWILDSEKRPFTRAQVAQCIKAFDQKLCYCLGHVKASRVSWAEMSDRERTNWIKGIGPQKPAIRQRMFRMLYDALKDQTRDG